MNVSTDRKVVLESLRDVPQEVVFHTSTAEKDQHVDNRYWFTFPQQWCNQIDKDSIIGIRNIYLTKHNRHINFNFTVLLCEYREDGDYDINDCKAKYKSTVNVYLDTDDTVKYVCKKFNESYPDNFETEYEASGFVHEWTDWEVELSYFHEDGQCNLLIGRPTGTDSYYVYDGVSYVYIITVEPLNDETKILMGIDDIKTDFNRVLVPIWSRYQLYLKSSISNEADDQFLGHTRNSQYTPIKYYRLTSDFKKWWIELYDTRDHRCEVILPSDGLDEVYIEGIVCFTTKAML